jgi:hypothetical protein
MNDLLSEDTPISNIQSIFTHMCMSASHSQVLIGSLHVGLCSSILNRPALTDSTPSTNRFVDSNCIQRLHNVSSCSMTPQSAATTPRTSASDLYRILSLCHFVHLPPSPTATRLETLSRVSFVFPVLSFSLLAIPFVSLLAVIMLTFL